MQKLVGSKTSFSLEEHLFENGAFRGEKWAFPVWVRSNPQTLACRGWRKPGDGREGGGKWLLPAVPGWPGPSSCLGTNLSAQARRCHRRPAARLAAAELVSRGAGPLLAAPANMLHGWVTENKPSRGRVGPGLAGGGLPTSFWGDLESGRKEARPSPQDC